VVLLRVHRPRVASGAGSPAPVATDASATYRIVVSFMVLLSCLIPIILLLHVQVPIPYIIPSTSLLHAPLSRIMSGAGKSAPGCAACLFVESHPSPATWAQELQRRPLVGSMAKLKPCLPYAYGATVWPGPEYETSFAPYPQDHGLGGVLCTPSKKIMNEWVKCFINEEGRGVWSPWASGVVRWKRSQNNQLDHQAQALSQHHMRLPHACHMPVLHGSVCSKRVCKSSSTRSGTGTATVAGFFDAGLQRMTCTRV